nr:MarR family transcriptional regulator [Qipengyuania qiaonensis]
MPEGLHVSHFAILNHLARIGDGQTPLQIAGAMQVAKGTMTHSLGVLERRGLVVLEPHPDDRRSKRVMLTDAGRAFRIAAVDILAQAMGGFSSEIDEADLGLLVPKLAELRKVLDANR